MTTATPPSRFHASQSGDGDPFPRPFGNYILLMPFARGGMGEVYLAKRGVILGAEKYCVLKKLRPELTEDREYVARFIDEARVVVQLNHANICQVFDVGRVGSEYYLAMEYVSGRDVRSLQDRARNLGLRVSEASVLYLLAETLAALDYAHRRTHPMTGEPLNLVHRDVSPQNVMVSFEGEVKLIDFGLASSRLKVERTQPNIVMGKMAYMAPEQARGDGIDKRADLFAAAVVGYEIMAGERFYEGMSSQEIWYVVGRGGFVPSKWTELSPDVARIFAKALHPDPDSRYATCAEFRDAVMAYLHTKHPGLGERSLRELMEDLYAEEILRERDMLLGFAEVSGDVVSDLLENTRSQSVSLARAGELLDPAGGGARVVHDERTQGSVPSRPLLGVATTQLAEHFSETTGSDERSEEQGIPEEQTLLEGAQLDGALDHIRTPPTGTIARGLAEELDHTSLDPGERTYLVGGDSVEQTAMVERAPFGAAQVVTVSVAELRSSGGRTLLAAAAALFVLVGGAVLLFAGKETAPTALATSSFSAGKDGAENALGAALGAKDVVAAESEAASETEAAAGAPLAEGDADKAAEPVPADEAALDAAPRASASGEAPPPKDDDDNDDNDNNATAAARPVPTLEAKAASAERSATLRRAKEAKRAAAADKAKEQREAAAAAAKKAAEKARERETRRAQARPAAAPQPRESLEQMVSVVMKCGLPSPCAKSDIGVPYSLKYTSMDADEKSKFDRHVRRCRKKCSP